MINLFLLLLLLILIVFLGDLIIFVIKFSFVTIFWITWFIFSLMFDLILLIPRILFKKYLK
jgi:hypothetical protein